MATQNKDSPQSEVDGRGANDRVAAPPPATPTGQSRHEHLCGPCSKTNRNLVAAKYCADCCEYLCAHCTDYHPNLGLTRDHVLIDVANMASMARSPSVRSNSVFIDNCEHHPDKKIEYYCRTCDAVGCSACSNSSTKLRVGADCKIDYIPDIVGNYRHGDTERVLLASVERLNHDVKQYEQQIKDNIRTLQGFYEKAQQNIRTFREEINAYLHQRETELIAKARDLRESDHSHMAQLMEECQKMDTDCLQLYSELCDRESHQVHLFVVAKRAKTQLKRLNDECTALQHAIKIRKYTFKPLSAIQEIVKSTLPLGDLVVQNAGVVTSAFGNTAPTSAISSVDEMTLTRKMKIDVKSPNDVERINISGMALLSADRLLLADSRNKSVKIVDTRKQVVTSRLTLARNPWDVACLPNEQAAVSMFKERAIQILSTQTVLETIGKIPVNGECRGIRYYDGNLVVAFESPERVETMTLDGVIQQSVQFNVVGAPLTGCPRYVTSIDSTLGHFIYVVDDQYNDSVIKLTIDGRRLAKAAADVKLTSTGGITALGDSHVVVCQSKGKSLAVVEDKGGEMKLAKEWACVKKPKSVMFSPHNDTLYVSSYSKSEDSYLHVYELHTKKDKNKVEVLYSRK